MARFASRASVALDRARDASGAAIDCLQQLQPPLINSAQSSLAERLKSPMSCKFISPRPIKSECQRALASWWDHLVAGRRFPAHAEFEPEPGMRFGRDGSKVEQIIASLQLKSVAGTVQRTSILNNLQLQADLIFSGKLK